MTRIGVMGGTFNPPHIGHVALAQAARQQLQLDHVLLVPAGKPPHRELPADPGREVRHDLCLRAIEHEPGLRVSRVEVDLEQVSYTVDTLTLLKQELPKDGLTLVIGADQAMTFEQWHRAREIPQLAEIAVAARSDAGPKQITQHMRDKLGVTPVIIQMPPIDVSSSEIRDRIRSGQAYSDLVPAGVFQMIEQSELYR